MKKGKKKEVEKKEVGQKNKKAVLIETKKLCKEFQNDKDVNKVLKEIDFKVYDKDFTIIMGSSGSGKSTLLYCISGMDTVTSGQVFYDGKELQNFKEKQIAKLRYGEFGFVFQQMHLVSNLTMLENVCIPGYLEKGKSSKEVEERAKALLERVNMGKRFKNLPSQVSGGEQQRVAIARAMINSPKLLFADEPTGALNRKNTEDVLDLLTELNQEGQSILAVTHDVKVAVRASRIIYLDDGTIAGELELGTYRKEEAQQREIQVNDWLTALSW